MVERNPRVFVSLPEGVFGKLERYAGGRKSKAATEAAYLLTKLLDELDQQGLIPPDDPAQAEAVQDLEEVIGFIKCLANNTLPSTTQSAEVARISDISEEKLRSLVQKFGECISISKTTQSRTQINILDLQRLADQLEIPSDRLLKAIKEIKLEVFNGH